MILDVLPLLATKRIVLASSSPRRIELLKRMGLSFEVIPSNFPENLDKSSFASPAAYARENARLKALDVWNTLSKNVTTTTTTTSTSSTPSTAASTLPDIIIIGVDSVVEKDSQILEKPVDKVDATRMLKSLSGGKSHVHSGVCILTRSKKAEVLAAAAAAAEEEDNDTGAGGVGEEEVAKEICFSESTEVIFEVLSDSLIDAYVATGEPFDKAGGYGIQGLAGSFISEINGCYYNVMGLPLHKVTKMLKTIVLA